MRWLDDIIDSKDMNFSKLWEMVKGREAQHAAVCGVVESQTQFSSSTTDVGTCHGCCCSCLFLQFLLDTHNCKRGEGREGPEGGPGPSALSWVSAWAPPPGLPHLPSCPLPVVSDLLSEGGGGGHLQGEVRDAHGLE